MDEQKMKRLERANPVVQVAIELGIKTRGNMGHCFRADRHSSENEGMTLFFNIAKNTFFCKTCPDVGGSVIDLVCQHRGLTREDAASWLAHRVEFDLETRERYHGKGWKKI